MNKNIILLLILVFFSGSLNTVAQRHQGRPAVLQEIPVQSVLKETFSEEATLKKASDYWFKVVNPKGKILGYAMTSTDYCKDVKGFANTTPVVIITDKKFTIKKVAMLSNYESPNYVKRLVDGGFFSNWVGKKVKEAQKDRVDGYTGATYTANAVVKNVNFLLENGGKKLPK